MLVKAQELPGLSVKGEVWGVYFILLIITNIASLLIIYTTFYVIYIR